MSQDRFEVSRRDVLRGAGAAAFLGAASPAMGQEKASPEGLRKLGPDPVLVPLTINGQKLSVKVEPRVTLLDALRDRLGLTGTKRVCDGGARGSSRTANCIRSRMRSLITTRPSAASARPA